MNKISVVFIYLGFFSLIGFAIYQTSSIMPLWFLFFTPSYSTEDDKETKLNNND